jgi:hypothetical protein
VIESRWLASVNGLSDLECAMDGDLMFASWTWGLSLIALTIALHAVGVVTMALVGLRFRVGLENHHLGSSYAIPIVIGVIGALSVDTTLPQRGRLARAPALLLMRP